jgi:hypothetical protein
MVRTEKGEIWTEKLPRYRVLIITKTQTEVAMETIIQGLLREAVGRLPNRVKASSSRC